MDQEQGDCDNDGCGNDDLMMLVVVVMMILVVIMLMMVLINCTQFCIKQ